METEMFCHCTQVQKLEELMMKESMQAEEMSAMKKENEELKDVLSAAQNDLENERDVRVGRVRVEWGGGGGRCGWGWGW